MILINQVLCNKTQLGTGRPPCEQKVGEYKSIYLVPRSWSLNVATDTFNKAYILEQVAKGNFIPLLNARSVTDNTPEPTQDEVNGNIQIVRNGKQMFTFLFNNGRFWNKSAYSFNSNGEWSVIFVDESDVVDLATSADGTKIMGYRTNFVNTRYTAKQGDTQAVSTVMLQLASEQQYNVNFALISASDIGMSLNTDIQGIIDVAFMNVVATAGDPITFKLVATNNPSYGWESFEATDFRVIDETTNAVLAIDTLVPGTDAGQYIMTMDAATTNGQKLRIETYNATYTATTSVLDDDSMYRGLVKATVAAIVVVGVFVSTFANTFV